MGPRKIHSARPTTLYMLLHGEFLLISCRVDRSYRGTIDGKILVLVNFELIARRPVVVTVLEL